MSWTIGHVKEQVLGIALLAMISAAFFTEPFDILMFTGCMYASIYVMAELGVLLGVLYRK
jgi:hypothetical protein